MKKTIAILKVSIMLMMVLTGCGKKAECYFCGEEKRCNTKTIMGEKLDYCKDCEEEIEDFFN